jgi:hypothetical protein
MGPIELGCEAVIEISRRPQYDGMASRLMPEGS